MIELWHMDVHHFVIDVISRDLSCLGEITRDINTIGFVSVYAFRVCDALVASCATTH